MILKTSREGELMVDHRASPGLPEGFMRDLGFAELPTSNRLFHAATMTCAHCNAVVIKEEGRTRERGHCQKCHAYICDGCVAKAAISVEHKSFNRILDEAEQRAYRADQNNLNLRFNLPPQT